jgi:hypothetical protein
MYQLSDNELYAVTGGEMNPVTKKLMISTAIIGSATLIYTQSLPLTALFSAGGCMITAVLIGMADPEFLDMWHDAFIIPNGSN